MAEPRWQGVRLQQVLPGLEATADLSSIIGPVADFLQSVGDFLDLVKQFLFDFTNPLQALLNEIIQQFIDLIEGLRQLGIHALFLFPDFMGDIELSQIKGGFNGFKQRVSASLTDTEDGNRPQYGPSDYMGGVVITLDTQNIGDLIDIVNRIYSFFDRAVSAQPAAPINLRVQPADEDGDPLDPTSVLSSTKIGGALLEWGTPGLLEPFTTPNFFLIERSAVKTGALQTTEVELDTFTNLEESGLQKMKVPVKQHGVQYSKWKVVAKVDPQIALVSTPKPEKDEFGLLHFPNSTTNEFLNVTGWVYNTIADGSYTFWDTTAAEGQTYYYRVRSLYKDAPSENIVNGKVTTSKNVSEPTPPASVSIPLTPTAPPKDADGDEISLLDAVLDLYRAAYAFQFYRTEKEFTDAGETPLLGIETLTQIDARHLFDYLLVVDGKGVPLDDLVGDVFDTISSYIATTTNRIAVRLGRRPAAASSFMAAYATQATMLRSTWEAYKETANKDDLKRFIDDPPSFEEVAQTSFEAQRKQTILLINLVSQLEAYPGAPPNWEGIRLIEDILPFLDQHLTTLTQWLRGFQKGTQGIINDIKEYIDYLQRKVEFLLDFLESIEELLQFIVAIDVGMYLLWIPPKQGGVTYFLNAFMAAEPAETTPILEPTYDEDGVLQPAGSSEVGPGPGGGPSDFTAGFLLTFGSPSAGVAEDDDGDFLPFKGVAGQYEATKAAMELLFGGL